MKKIFYLLFCLLGSLGILSAQVPQAFNYSAVLRNKAGDLLKSQQLEVQISILEESEQGKAVYQETHSTKTSGAGTIFIKVGQGTPVLGKMDEIDWSKGNYYIQTLFTLNGERIDLGATQLLSVPYAFYALHSGDGGGSISGGGNTTVSGSCLWSREGLATAAYTGSIALKTSDKKDYFKAYSDLTSGHMTLYSDGKAAIQFDPDLITLYDAEGKRYVDLGNNGLPMMRVMDGTNTAVMFSNYTNFNNGQYNVATLGISASKSGFLNLSDGTTGKITASLAGGSAGSLTLYNKSGTKVNVVLSTTNSSDDNVGFISTKDADGNDLIALSTLLYNDVPYQDCPYLALRYHGARKGSFYIDIDGYSCLEVDKLYLDGSQLRSSTTDYTANLRSSSAHAPCFVSESTDRQITFRGTATLRGGKFTVVLPPEEAAKIQERTVTVQLTPLSADSKGLAVVKKAGGSFEVAELMGGTGSYDFDWTLTALRKVEPTLRSHERTEGAPAAPIKGE